MKTHLISILISFIQISAIAQDTIKHPLIWKFKANIVSGNPEQMDYVAEGGYTAFGGELGIESRLYKKFSVDLWISYQYAGFIKYEGINLDEVCKVDFNRKGLELNFKYNIPLSKKAKRRKSYFIIGVGPGYFIPGKFYSRSSPDEFFLDYKPSLGFQVYFGLELKFSKYYALNIGVRGRNVLFNSTTTMTKSQSIYYSEFNKLDASGEVFNLGIVKYFY